MDLNQILAVLKRWIGVIIGVVVVIALGIFINFRSSADEFSTTVRLQLTAPDRDDVRLVDEYRFVNDREEATSARNNFTELARDRSVYNTTQEELGLSDLDMNYAINVSAVQDSDFVIVKFTAPTNENLIEIANEHVAQTIKALGNTRALASEASLGAYSIQLDDSIEILTQAEDELAAFQATHEIIALEREIQIEERVIETLEIEKAQLSIQQAQDDGSAVTSQSSIANIESQISAIDLQIQEEILNQLVIEQDGILGNVVVPEDLSTSEKNSLSTLEKSINSQAEEVQKLKIANLEQQKEILTAELELLKESGVDNPAALLLESQIQERRDNLTRLRGLEPEYNILKANTEGALETYDLVLTKYNESEVRAEVNRGASFVQVVANANNTFSEPNPMVQFLVLGIAAGLVLGVLLAFILENFYPNHPDQGSTVSIVKDKEESSATATESLALGASNSSD